MIGTAYAAAAEHAGSGLPQFQSSFFSSQIFWAFVSFATLLALLTKYVLPGINDVLDARSRQIENDLKEAEKNRTASEKVLKEQRKELAAAREMASKIADEARQDAIQSREEALSELEAELSRVKTSAFDEIEQAKRKAVSEVKNVAVDLTIQATEMLIAKSVTKVHANKMVDEAIREISQNQSEVLH